MTLSPGRVVRFLIVGGLNSLITYAIFFVLALALPAWLSYAIAYGIGIIIAYVGNGKLVFVAATTARDCVPYGAMQLMLMLGGALLTTFFQKVLIFPAWGAGLCAMIVLVPASLAANSLFFARSREKAAQQDADDPPGPTGSITK